MKKMRRMLALFLTILMATCSMDIVALADGMPDTNGQAEATEISVPVLADAADDSMLNTEPDIEDKNMFEIEQTVMDIPETGTDEESDGNSENAPAPNISGPVDGISDTNQTENDIAESADDILTDSAGSVSGNDAAAVETPSDTASDSGSDDVGVPKDVPDEVQVFLDAVAAIPEIMPENVQEVSEYVYGEVSERYEALLGTEYEDMEDVQAAVAKYLAAVEAVDSLSDVGVMNFTVSDTAQASSNITKRGFSAFYPISTKYNTVSVNEAESGYGEAVLDDDNRTATDFLYTEYLCQGIIGSAYPVTYDLFDIAYEYTSSVGYDPSIATASVVQGTYPGNGRACLEVTVTCGPKHGTTVIPIYYSASSLACSSDGSPVFSSVSGYVFYTVTNNVGKKQDKPVEKPVAGNINVHMFCDGYAGSNKHYGRAGLLSMHTDKWSLGEIVPCDWMDGYEWFCPLNMDMNKWTSFYNKNYGTHMFSMFGHGQNKTEALNNTIPVNQLGFYWNGSSWLFYSGSLYVIMTEHSSQIDYTVIHQYYTDDSFDGQAIETRTDAGTGSVIYPDRLPKKYAYAGKEYGYESGSPNPLVCSDDVTGNVVTLRYEREAVKTYTVTYTDGVPGTAFADQSFEGLREGDATPDFEGDMSMMHTDEHGDTHVFAGWSPDVNPVVNPDDADEDGNIVYTAIWEKALTVSKSSSTEYPAVGEDLTYIINVHNPNNREIAVKVTDVLDEKLDLVWDDEEKMWAVTDDGIYDEDTRTVTWTDVGVPANGDKMLCLVVRPNATGQIYNKAKMTCEVNDTSGNTTVFVSKVPAKYTVYHEYYDNGEISGRIKGDTISGLDGDVVQAADVGKCLTYSGESYAYTRTNIGIKAAEGLSIDYTLGEEVESIELSRSEDKIIVLRYDRWTATEWSADLEYYVNGEMIAMVPGLKGSGTTGDIVDLSRLHDRHPEWARYEVDDAYRDFTYGGIDRKSMVLNKKPEKNVAVLRYDWNHIHEYEAVTEPDCIHEGLRKCSCGDEQSIAALGHDFTDAAWTDGKGHTEGCTSTEHIRECARCHGTLEDGSESEAHDMSEWETVKEPTETEEGLMTRHCLKCDHVESEPVDKLPAKPVEPDKPVKPDEPIEPDKPVKPDESTEPDKPDKPAKPDKPKDPAKPEEPVDVKKPEESELFILPDEKTPLADVPQTGNDIFYLFPAFLSGLGLILRRHRK